jgi:hypothetical protein
MGFLFFLLSQSKLIIYLCASIWICQAQAAANSMPRTQQGENPALRIIFFRVCHLLAQSIQPVFVADGPDRPRVKRSVNVRADKPHWMEAYVEDFVREAGCPMYRVRNPFTPFFLFFSLTLIRPQERLRPSWLSLQRMVSSRPFSPPTSMCSSLGAHT